MANEKKQILVVEDNDSLTKLIKLKLEKEGFRALVAPSGEKALKILEKENPDLIWLDVYLPNINGLEFLEKIRKNPKTKDLKVIIVSVSGSTKKIEKAEELLISDYLVKSNYKISEIIDRINIIFKNDSGK